MMFDTRKINLLKEEILEEVGCVDNDEDQHGWQVDGQDGVQDPTLEDNGHLDARVHIAGIVVSERPVGDKILSEHCLRFHCYQVRRDLHHRCLQLPDDQVHHAHLTHHQV